MGRILLEDKLLRSNVGWMICLAPDETGLKGLSLTSAKEVDRSPSSKPIEVSVSWQRMAPGLLPSWAHVWKVD